MPRFTDALRVAEESGDAFTGRTSRATAALLGQEATVFPSHHGGFLGGEHGYAGQPEACGRRLREVLDIPVYGFFRVLICATGSMSGLLRASMRRIVWLFESAK